MDLGGNVIFLKEDSKTEIIRALERILSDQHLYHSMKLIAETKGPQTFSYGKIAQKSIEE